MAAFSEHWLYNLGRNLFGYSFVLIPLLLFVWTARNTKLRYALDKFKFLTIVAFARCEWPENRENKDIVKLELSAIPPPDKKKGEKQEEDDGFSLRKVLLLITCAVGLHASYLLWGVLQERIMVTEYLSNQQPEDRNSTATFRFKDSQFLVFGNRICAFVVSAVVVIATKILAPPSRQTVLFNAPYYTFAFCALSNIMSSWCQIEALKYIAFPTQVLSKACKIVPVMLMGHFFMKKKYKLADYVQALIITSGTALFMYEDARNSTKANKVVADYSPLNGLLLLGLFLVFDAFTSNWQAYLFRRNKPSSWEMMAMVNLYSILLTLASLLEGGTFVKSFQMVVSHTSLFKDIVFMSLTSATGQCFIFVTIAKFGPLIFVVIMTVRQVLSIIISQLIYGHYISPLAIVGVCIIFGTILGQVFLKFREQRLKKKKEFCMKI